MAADKPCPQLQPSLIYTSGLKVTAKTWCGQCTRPHVHMLTGEPDEVRARAE